MKNYKNNLFIMSDTSCCFEWIMLSVSNVCFDHIYIVCNIFYFEHHLIYIIVFTSNSIVIVYTRSQTLEKTFIAVSNLIKLNFNNFIVKYRNSLSKVTA